MVKRNKPILLFTILLCVGSLWVINGCASKYVADTDADQLVAAMQELPKVQSYLASVHFYPELNTKTGKAIVENADSRNLKEIIYSENEMLNLAAHASMFRWFQEINNEENLPILNIHARIFKLEHSIKVDAGRMQPVAETKLEVYLTDENKNRIYESVFTAQAIGPKGDLLLNKYETQDAYGHTIYKVLVLAFESAFADIVDKLNLKPINFDVDDVKLSESIENNTQVQVTKNN